MTQPAQPVRLDLYLAAPIANGTLVDVVVASQPGLLGDSNTGTWLQIVETGVIYADAVFYRKPSAITDHAAPPALAVRDGLSVHAQFRGRVTYCRVCAIYTDRTSTTLVVQPETASSGYR